MNGRDWPVEKDRMGHRGKSEGAIGHDINYAFNNGNTGLQFKTGILLWVSLFGFHFKRAFSLAKMLQGLTNFFLLIYNDC